MRVCHGHKNWTLNVSRPSSINPLPVDASKIAVVISCVLDYYDTSASSQTPAALLRSPARLSQLCRLHPGACRSMLSGTFVMHSLSLISVATASFSCSAREAHRNYPAALSAPIAQIYREIRIEKDTLTTARRSEIGNVTADFPHFRDLSPSAASDMFTAECAILVASSCILRSPYHRHLDL